MKRGKDSDAVPSLMDVLREAIEDAGKAPRHVRYRYDRSEKQIKRYLTRESFPPGEDLDQFVEAVAAEIKPGRYELWRRAIKKAEQAGRAEVPEPHEVVKQGLPLPAEQKRRRSA